MQYYAQHNVNSMHKHKTQSKKTLHEGEMDDQCDSQTQTWMDFKSVESSEDFSR